MLKYKRKKPFNLLNSLIYRLNKLLPLTSKIKFKLYSNLEWIFWRLASETSHKLYDDEIHISRHDFVNFLKNKIDKNYSVIDIGCSDGRNTFILSRLCKVVVAVDHNKEFIRIAKQKYKQYPISFINDDVNNYAIKNNLKFDVAICSHILEHLDDPESFLKSILSYTKYVYVEVPDFESNYLNLIRKDQKININYTDNDHIYEFDRKNIKKMFKSLNLFIEEEEYKFGMMRFWLVTNHQ